VNFKCLSRQIHMETMPMQSPNLLQAVTVDVRLLSTVAYFSQIKWHGLFSRLNKRMCRSVRIGFNHELNATNTMQSIHHKFSNSNSYQNFKEKNLNNTPPQNDLQPEYLEEKNLWTCNSSVLSFFSKISNTK
jgi:hypothetical protein